MDNSIDKQQLPETLGSFTILLKDKRKVMFSGSAIESIDVRGGSLVFLDSSGKGRAALAAGEWLSVGVEIS